MSEQQWNSTCKAAFLALYAAMRLCHKIGMNPHDLLDMLRERLQQDGCIAPDGSIIVKEDSNEPPAGAYTNDEGDRRE